MMVLGFIFSGFIYIFLFVPMIVLVALSFNTARSGAEWQGFTTDWYSKLFSNQAILDALFNSLEIAVSATVLSAVLGTAIGMTLGRSQLSGKKSLAKIANLPIVFPDIVLALSLLAFFDLIRLPLGKISVIIAHSSFGAAYVAVLVRARLKAMDPLLEEAASDLGAGAARTFLNITFPQLVPAVVSGMLMVFTLSFDDFIVAFFTAGVDSTTLPMKIYSMLKFGVTPEVNALSALILCTSLMLVTIAFWSRGRVKQNV